MSNEIVPFDFHGNEVRVVMLDGEPWWVVNDVCKAMTLSDPRRAAERVDAEDRTITPIVDSRGAIQHVWVVNESGLYQLILRSSKPQAKAFRRWVTGAVLPQIRKTGSYTVKALSPGEVLVQQAQMLVEQERRTAALEQHAESTERRLASIEQKTDWYTALGYAKREALPTHHRYLNALGRAATHIAHGYGITPAKVHNEAFGEVNSYPEWVLSEAAGGLV